MLSSNKPVEEQHLSTMLRTGAGAITKLFGSLVVSVEPRTSTVPNHAGYSVRPYPGTQYLCSTTKFT